MNASNVQLNEIFTDLKQKFTYIYDFGDDWIHQIILEEITGDQISRAECIAGKGACPPEDCGGPSGYAHLKAVMANSQDPEHATIKQWLEFTENEKWDTEDFDLERAKHLVSMV